MTHLRTVRLAMLAGTILVAALALAACGSSSNTSSGSASAAAASSSSSSASGTAANRSKFVSCLKAHGVTLPSRPPGAHGAPSGSGEGGAPPAGGAPSGGSHRGFFFGGGGGRAGAGSRFNNPKFQAAIKACGGGQFQRRRFTPNKAAITKFVACVKQHGYNLPTPNFSGKGPVFPANIERNKKFQTAARACASDLRPQGAAGGPGAPGAAGGASSGGGSSD